MQKHDEAATDPRDAPSAAPEAAESDHWQAWRSATEPQDGERRPGRKKLVYDKEKRAIVEVATDPRVGGAPIDMVLFCPNCAEQHIDEAKPDVCETCGKGESECSCVTYTAWLNPPHKSHRCNYCNYVWRPADVPTNGVKETKTRGRRDEDAKPRETKAIALEAQLADITARLRAACLEQDADETTLSDPVDWLIRYTRRLARGIKVETVRAYNDGRREAEQQLASAHNAKRTAEENELAAAAELDEVTAQLAAAQRQHEQFAQDIADKLGIEYAPPVAKGDCAYLAAIERLKEQSATVRAALVKVEWGWVSFGSGSYHEVCAWCRNLKQTGHRSDCPRQLALEAPEAAREGGGE